MSSPFLAEIRIFGGKYAPVQWASCDGQTLNISQNTALFSVIGVSFGGDGRSNFRLPNFAGNVPVGVGSGPGLTPRSLGQAGGTTTVALTPTTLATHNHPMNSRPQSATTGAAGPNESLATVNPSTSSAYQTNSTSSLTPLNPSTLQPIGGNGAHNNVQPYLALFFIICLYGRYPTRP